MTEKKDTDELIQTLAADLKPDCRVLCPLRMVSPWVVIAFAYMAGVVHFIGVRMDWEDRIRESAFVFEIGLSGFLAVFSAYAAGWLSIPDMRGRGWILAVPTSLFGVFMFWIVCLAAEEGFHLPDLGWHHCFSDALLMGFVPIASLSMLVRRGATTRPGWMAFMSVLSVGALGWIALRLTCAADNVGHTMLFHFLPFVLVAALLGGLARRVYRW